MCTFEKIVGSNLLFLLIQYTSLIIYNKEDFFFFLVLFFSLVPSFECLPVWSVMISYNKIDI